jgi:hypothetical protein
LSRAIADDVHCPENRFSAILMVSGGVMNNPLSSAVPIDPRQAAIEDDCYSISNLMFGFGVVALICGPAITGHAQASIVGLALIILSNFLD